ncbi:MAG: amidohydrolase [Spirochaetaceae bacterium]|nr:amidohydrolase [Spirochaetaceae bacterium]
MEARDIAALVEARAAEYDALARTIWERPEPAYEEAASAALHRERLAARGFRVAECPEMANSFIAERGSGKPVVALMGEYDALPGMSQACGAVREPLVAGGAGHACGHNLLGVGSLAAAEALADAAEASGLAGTVRYYGCPAEEALGRIPLVKAGRFDDVDAALTWHPADVNTPHRYATNANLALAFRFRGRASHAALAPSAGRSALDAVQLMNLGLEFLREHLEPGVLLHYVITDGGRKANIVPETAATSLYVRAPRASGVRAAYARVLKVARGAALMTETAFEAEASHGKCDFIPNEAIHGAMARAMAAIALPSHTAEEKAFARALAATVDRRDRGASLAMIGAPESLLRAPIHEAVGDYGRGFRVGGSLDTGDVSYVAPTGQMNAATWPLGVGAHTWQACAASGSSQGAKAMRWAASVLAATGYALLSDPALLAAARTEHRRARRPYRSTMDL